MGGVGEYHFPIYTPLPGLNWLLFQRIHSQKCQTYIHTFYKLHILRIIRPGVLSFCEMIF